MYGNEYFTPYQMAMPTAIRPIRKSIDWSNLLNNTQRTLGIINQAIPIVYQLKPIVNNAKTMFRIFDAVKSDDKKETRKNESVKVAEQTVRNDNQPNFFL